MNVCTACATTPVKGNGLCRPCSSALARARSRRTIAELRPDVAARFADSSPHRPDEVVPTGGEEVHVHCTSCHQVRRCVAKNACSTEHCIRCAARIKKLEEQSVAVTHPELARLFSPRSPYGPDAITAGSSFNVIVQCSRCGQERDTGIRTVVQTTLCEQCSYRIAWHHKYASRFEALLPYLAVGHDAEFPYLLGDRAEFVGTCGHVTAATFETFERRGRTCEDCFSPSRRAKQSKGERELASYVRGLGYDVKVNRRSVIANGGKRLELDLWLPDGKLAFEFNGEYWHSDEFMGEAGSAERYHRAKLEACATAGIRLAFVWEGDWQRRTSEVKTAVERFLVSGGRERWPILSRLTSEKDANAVLA